MSDWTPASHGVLIPPFGSGKAIPNEENHVKSGWSVRNTTAQNIHLVNPPPIANASVPVVPEGYACQHQRDQSS